MKPKPKQLDRDLLDAVVMGDLAKVSMLIKQGADVNARDGEHQETPLILAVKFGQAAIVRLLIDSGANLEARDDQGRTALFFAAISSETFDVLIRSGANPHVKDADGNTILMRTIMSSPGLNEVEELLRLGIDAGVRNNDGETSDMADALGLIKIAERLRSIVVI